MIKVAPLGPALHMSFQGGLSSALLSAMTSMSLGEPPNERLGLSFYIGIPCIFRQWGAWIAVIRDETFHIIFVTRGDVGLGILLKVHHDKVQMVRVCGIDCSRLASGTIPGCIAASMTKKMLFVAELCFAERAPNVGVT